MDILTSIYQISEVPENLLDKLLEDQRILNKLLNLEYYTASEIKHIEDFLSDIEEYPIEPILPTEIDNAVSNFTRDIIGETMSISQLYKEAIEREDTVVIESLLASRNILSEQSLYLEYELEKEPDCSIWFITSQLSGCDYGGIFAFWNKKKPDILFIQGIAKYLATAFTSIFLPEFSKKIPSLNTVLQPPIESLARQLGADKIIVAPVGKQGEILRKHFGYRRVDHVYYPCQEIVGRENVMINTDRYKVYMKQIE